MKTKLKIAWALFRARLYCIFCPRIEWLKVDVTKDVNGIITQIESRDGEYCYTRTFYDDGSRLRSGPAYIRTRHAMKYDAIIAEPFIGFTGEGKSGGEKTV